jgi:hypothetical protein
MGCVRKGIRGHGSCFPVRMAAVAVAVMAFAMSAARANDPELVLHNRTGVDIQELYLSPAGAAEWRAEVLGGEPVLDGDDAEIPIPYSGSSSKWDLKLVDREGASLVWPSVDVEKNSEVTLRLSKGRPFVEPAE